MAKIDDSVLIRLWNDGMSGAAIAERFGGTRNAILGRIMRLRARGAVLRSNVNAAPKISDAAILASHESGERVVDLIRRTGAGGHYVAARRKALGIAKPKGQYNRQRGAATVPEHIKRLATRPRGKHSDAAFYRVGRQVVEGHAGCRPRPLLDLRPGDCRWPIDHDGQMLFCGRPAREVGSYCAEHRALGTQAVGGD